MTRPVDGGRSGPSPSGALRVLGYAAALVVGGGAPAVFGTLQALSAPDPPVRLAMLLAWSLRTVPVGVAGAALGPVRGLLVPAVLVVAAALLGLLLARLLAAARTARRAAAADRTAAAAPAAPAAPAATTAHGSAAVRRPVGPSAPVVVVGAVTGSLGRAWLGDRAWTVRGTGERLREGELYVVLARRGEVLEVVTSP